MIVAVCSAKGAPGVTSTALTLAAVWSRPVVLLEADPTGGDLAFRCRAHGGGPVAETPNLLGLAAAARSSRPGSLSQYTQLLASGVPVIQGVTSQAQGRGLAGLWAPIAQACRDVDIDIVVDLGRLDSAAPVMAMVTAADRVLVACTASLESVFHTRELVAELASIAAPGRGPGPGPSVSKRVMPLVIGPAKHARADRADVDEVMTAQGVPVAPAAHLPLDHPALVRLEGGESADGRLSRTLLIRAARAIAESLVADALVEGVSA